MVDLTHRLELLAIYRQGIRLIISIIYMKFLFFPSFLCVCITNAHCTHGLELLENPTFIIRDGNQKKIHYQYRVS